MTVVLEDGSIRLHLGDCVEVLASMPAESVDAVVTDPPYGLEFMGREWDSFRTYAGGNPNIKPQGPTVGESSGATYGYRQKTPRCRRCGKLQRGNGCCKCPEPDWDTRTAESGFVFQAWCESWAQVALRVLKPGGHLLAFGGTRTYHRLTCAIEDAGFEIRDCIAWMYGSGFPKSLDVSKAIDRAAGAEREVVGRYQYPDGSGERSVIDCAASSTAYDVDNPRPGGSVPVTAPATPEAQAWAGWGTALKPAHEPIVVARKPLRERTVAAQVLATRTGALNIDACRIAGTKPHREVVNIQQNGWDGGGAWKSSGVGGGESAEGRWPANVCLDHEAANRLDAEVGERPGPGSASIRREFNPGEGWGGIGAVVGQQYPGEAGGPSRFFYTAKASASERDGATHPTVKPIDLMRWLVRLVTPPRVVRYECHDCEYGSLSGMRPGVQAKAARTGALLDRMPSEGGGSQPEASTDDVRRVRDADERRPGSAEVLFGGVPGGERENPTAAMPEVRGDVPPPRTAEVLLPGVRLPIPAEDGEGMRDVRGDVPPAEAESAVLLQEVREEATGADHHAGRLQGPVDAGPPDGGEVRLPDGASPSDGSGVGADADLERGGPSHQRGQGGQPTGELDGHGSDGPQPGPEGSAADGGMPPLQGPAVAGECPSCGGALTAVEGPGFILEPFAGSGTTLIAARLEGFGCIGIERDPDYAEMAAERYRRRWQPAEAKWDQKDDDDQLSLLAV